MGRNHRVRIRRLELGRPAAYLRPNWRCLVVADVHRVASLTLSTDFAGTKSA
jgi:hypothetical protein